MSNEFNNQINKFLENLAELLDISQTHYDQAEARYHAICKWLARDESVVVDFNPTMYPQGSFRLGTVIKPFTDEEQYDIDLVCELNLTKDRITQKQLKELIGGEIISYAEANNMNSPPENCKRCWKLLYAEGARFHMDVLPAIPDGDDFGMVLEQKGFTNQWSKQAIAITDKTHCNYEHLDREWPASNPRGYAEWFKSRMETKTLREALKAHIEDVPIYKTRTPLQRAIQLLKRHRDFMFAEDQDDKPISIIITTLAAHVYNEEEDILETLTNIVRGMPSHIEMRNGISWVANPVNPLENFADKWEANSKLEKNFRNWLQQVKVDLNEALTARNVKAFGESLKSRWGERAVNKALREFSETTEYKSWTSVDKPSQLSKEFDVLHKQSPQWPVIRQGTVNISVQASRNGFRPKQIQDGNSLPKHYSLRFEAKTSIQRPYKVYWQVVNTGDEARVVNCLRGEFYNSIIEKGKRIRKESTLYTGMHWVECFIVKDGICVARSGEFVVNIE